MLREARDSGVCTHLRYISVAFGCKGILIIFGIFQAYETQRVRLKQVNDSRSCMLLVPQSHPSSANRKTRHLI
ncbi:hypothetical protein RRG08_000602 [Elysia crispata]|uniref:Uncharacterized protein n=1 Tax=Elysia crispata TaxID=231223 RepID=A0AAE1CUD4_9GAST|nr:hypothetical protein RRG08_000602 [Elysia crispata]